MDLRVNSQPAPKVNENGQQKPFVSAPKGFTTGPKPIFSLQEPDAIAKKLDKCVKMFEELMADPSKLGLFEDEIKECETLNKMVEEDIKRHEAEKNEEAKLKSLADEYLKSTPEDRNCINIITGIIRDRNILSEQYDQLPPFMRETVLDTANTCMRRFLGAPLKTEPQRQMPNFQNNNIERST